MLRCLQCDYCTYSLGSFNEHVQNSHKESYLKISGFVDEAWEKNRWGL